MANKETRNGNIKRKRLLWYGRMKRMSQYQLLKLDCLPPERRIYRRQKETAIKEKNDYYGVDWVKGSRRDSTFVRGDWKLVLTNYQVWLK